MPETRSNLETYTVRAYTPIDCTAMARLLFPVDGKPETKLSQIIGWLRASGVLPSILIIGSDFDLGNVMVDHVWVEQVTNALPTAHDVVIALQRNLHA